jgi:uncharacterized protein YndB with AHSA1/START domain
MSALSRVELRRTLQASIERVFAAFSDPVMVAQWLRPSPDVLLTVLTFEFREGGRYRFAYDVPDGNRMVVGGHYKVIEHPRRIVFSWLIEPPDEHAGIESEVIVQLATVTPNATQLEISHSGWGRKDAEARHSAGWTGALDLLEGELARNTQGQIP